MAERAIFLDRDNTLIDNDGYLGDPGKVKLLPGASTALTALRALGYRLIVVSNQSGVARGMFKETDVEAVNDEMSRQLRQQAGAYVDASYYCPFHPESPLAEYRVDHDWRKPKPGMLLQAAADFGLELPQCWMVGDSWRDVAAGATAGCRTILLRDPDRKPNAEDQKMDKTVTPSFVVASLGDAARIIVREGRHGPPPPPPAPPAPDVPPPPTKEEPPEPAAATVAVPPPPVPPPSPLLDESALVERVAEKLAEKRAAADAANSVADAVAAPKEDPAKAETTNTAQAKAWTQSVPLEKQLDDLVMQLRQQNRNAELRPDFSLSHIAVVIVQAFALFGLGIGLVKYFTMKVTFDTPQAPQFALMSHLQSLIWIMVAVFLQGVVVALLILGRNR